MGKFKVGDRVRLKEEYTTWAIGTEGVVTGVSPGWDWQEENSEDLVYTDTVSGVYAKRLELVPAWQPKVGDRVRFTDAVPSHWFFGPATQHKEGVIRSDSEGGGGLRFTVNVGNSYGYVNLEHIEPAAPVVTETKPTVDNRANAGGGFKAGDRIRLVKDPVAKHCEIGDEFIAVARGDRNNGVASSVHYTGKDGSKTWRPGSYFDLVEPLTITAGGYYKTRDGRKVGPVVVAQGQSGYWSWKLASGTHYYRNDGFSCPGWADGHRHADDLIAEWVDEPAAQPATIANDNAAPAKFKVGDRVFAKFAEISGNGTIIRVDDHDVTMPYLVDIDGKTSIWCYAEDVTGQQAPTPTAIVALIEDGQPKPSARPFVHATVESATTEASRLAGKHKGQQFGVYVLTTTSQEAAPTYKHEWQRLAAKGEKINAIKELRAVTGMPLKQSKDVVEHFVEYPYGAAA